jgi:AAA family ATP:ADP antiporter
MLLGSYYILKPVRDTVATVFGVDELQNLFTGTFIGTLIASPIYAWLASRVTLKRLLPGVFWFWLLNVLLFQVLLRRAPESRAVAAAYYIWFSVVNLFMISVFWSLMVDLFSPRQATRLFAFIAAGGSIGAIAGPLVTRFAVHAVGLNGLLLIAAVGFVIVITLVHLLMHEKDRRRRLGREVQRTTLDHGLVGNPFEGFGALIKSAYSRHQAAFMLLMTWVNTVAYFFQTDLIARTISAVEGRAIAIADIALAVNVLSALVLTFGLGRFVQRFGVTAGLVLNPLIMLAAFVAIALSPTLFMIQALQVVRQVGQFAIARPSREICFTVVEQSARYKTKNVIDTVIYRFGDLGAAWVQAGLRVLGFRIVGSAALGFGVSALWGVVAVLLGRRYEALRGQQAAAPAAAAQAQPLAEP